jgi:hypothetical protein
MTPSQKTRKKPQKTIKNSKKIEKILEKTYEKPA